MDLEGLTRIDPPKQSPVQSGVQTCDVCSCKMRQDRLNHAWHLDKPMNLTVQENRFSTMPIKKRPIVTENIVQNMSHKRPRRDKDSLTSVRKMPSILTPFNYPERYGLLPISSPSALRQLQTSPVSGQTAPEDVKFGSSVNTRDPYVTSDPIGYFPKLQNDMQHKWTYDICDSLYRHPEQVYEDKDSIVSHILDLTLKKKQTPALVKVKEEPPIEQPLVVDYKEGYEDIPEHVPYILDLSYRQNRYDSSGVAQEFPMPTSPMPTIQTENKIAHLNLLDIKSGSSGEHPYSDCVSDRSWGSQTYLSPSEEDSSLDSPKEEYLLDTPLYNLPNDTYQDITDHSENDTKRHLDISDSRMARKQNEANQNDKNKAECTLLWEFLDGLLSNGLHDNLIRWEDRETLTFRIVNPNGLAQLWGVQKCKANMTYEKMSRALRYYYKMNIIEKVPGRRLTYRYTTHPQQIVKGIRGAKPGVPHRKRKNAGVLDLSKKSNSRRKRSVTTGENAPNTIETTKSS